MSSLILLSGAVCAGKTTLAEGLLGRATVARILTTRTLIAAWAPPTAEQLDRASLQQLGEALDRRTRGKWVADAVQLMSFDHPIVVDAVRTSDQVAAVRKAAPALHIHLTASESVLEKRYAQRVSMQPAFERPTFAALRLDPTEASIERLASHADLIVDTGLYGEHATLMYVLNFLAN